ncbi:hypothetical protein D3C71_2153510 [compost metagenome]
MKASGKITSHRKPTKSPSQGGIGNKPSTHNTPSPARMHSKTAKAAGKKPLKKM